MVELNEARKWPECSFMADILEGDYVRVSKGEVEISGLVSSSDRGSMLRICSLEDAEVETYIDDADDVLEHRREPKADRATGWYMFQDAPNGDDMWVGFWQSTTQTMYIFTANDMKAELEKLGYTVTEPHREDGWYPLTDGGFSHVRYSDDNVWYREVNSAGQGCDSMFPATTHYTSIIHLGPYVEKEE